jgi:Zn-dependent oligopeptidase
MMMATNSDRELRKAAFMGREETSAVFVEDLIRLVKARNRFARLMGYENFYDYKAHTEERMSAQTIWSFFEDMIPVLTKPHAEIRAMESFYPDIREPREFAYTLNGDTIKRDDPYFPLETLLDVWGRSFTGLGISYRGARINLDLLERRGKYNNGFCHCPRPVFYRDNMRISGHINCTCTAIVGHVGAGLNTGNTLFHEGGHAAHFANMDCQDVILNTEYIPQSIAWAETQSMFFDDMFHNIQRQSRYAQTLDGRSYPFHFFEESVRKTYAMRGRSMLGIVSVVLFEKFLYTAREEDLTPSRVCDKARELSVTLFDRSTPSLRLLTIPHLYSRNSSCYYHGYGMATVAVEQRKKYFTDRDGYLVDNHRIGPEMMAVWAL